MLEKQGLQELDVTRSPERPAPLPSITLNIVNGAAAIDAITQAGVDFFTTTDWRWNEDGLQRL